MSGWCGRIALIDLTRNQVETAELDPDLCRRFVGGRGMAGHFLKDSAHLDWDNPDMPILLFTGPLVGTASPTSGRMTVMSRSPLTGTVGDSSVGGTFGTQLKKAGLDGLIITGRSKTVCGIEITDHGIFIAACPHLNRQPVSTVLSRLKPGGATAVIGPAAENGVLYAGLIIDGEYAAGRGGIGCCFAAKNIKYITVKGSGRIRTADPEALKDAREDIYRLVSASPAISGPFGISRFGTPALYDLMDSRHMMPTRNFTQSRFEGACTANAHALHQRFHPLKTGCAGCHIRCKKKSTDGHHLPEFETLSHFSALIGNSELDTVMAANGICNDLGMDTISAASVLACHFEINEIEPSPALVISLLTDIGLRRGVGIELGQGAARYATSKGKPEAAMSVKHLELPAYDPRGACGMALAYAVATRGDTTCGPIPSAMKYCENRFPRTASPLRERPGSSRCRKTSMPWPIP